MLYCPVFYFQSADAPKFPFVIGDQSQPFRFCVTRKNAFYQVFAFWDLKSCIYRMEYYHFIIFYVFGTNFLVFFTPKKSQTHHR